jgi:translation initiation factor IF-2
MPEAATKIRIFSLAKELGLDSKVLIEHCRAAGLTVKGSALASISPEEKELVLGHMSGSEPEEPAEPVDTLTPTRESTSDPAKRMRTIRAMAPQVLPRRETEVTPEAEVLPTEEVVPAIASVTESDATDELDADNEANAVDEADLDSTAADDSSITDAGGSAPVLDDPAQDPDDFETHSRDDYMPAHGGGPVKEMVPRGTPTHSELQARREKARSRPSMPGLAPPPKFEPARSKRKTAAEPVAQKPDIPLTPNQLGGKSPLAGRLKKTSEDKRAGGGKKKDVEFTNQEGEPKRGGGSLDAARAQRRQRRQGQPSGDDYDSRRRRRMPRKRRTGPVDLKTSATLELPVTIRSLSEAIGRPAKQILGALFARGTMARINDSLDEESAWEISAELGVELKIRKQQTSEELLTEIVEMEEAEDVLQTRPPVVTILGHVDHGKTSLLDKIRETTVADGEAGGITQHIRAYQVKHGDHKVTFVDTPGHAAFAEMRARGANVTDIIVLVVAANDSVMPQTVECIAHAKASGAPIIVAMNKMDLPDINEQRVLTDLANHGVQPHEWGGEVEVIRTSAMSGQGLDDLLETILLTAEIGELKANPDRQALGVCIEAFRDEGVGPIAWLVVQTGTLRVGDVMLCGSSYGRIRAIYNDSGETIQEAAASMPVKVSGLGEVPGAGDHFYVLDDIEQAREIAEERAADGRAEVLSRSGQPRTLEDILDAAREGQVQDLNLILKGDTPGSLEALKGEIEKFEHPEVRVKLLHDAVGGVNESDIYLARASDAIIIAFHVIAEDRALSLAEQVGVEIRRYNIIYEVIDEIRRTLEGLLKPELVQVATGRAIVLQTFSISRTGTIAGCRVLNGTIGRNNRVHVIRDQKVLNDYQLASLRRVKDDVKEVREGMECGIRLEGFNDVKDGDLLESFRIDSVKRTLDD